jgi:hypothetical protein
MVHYSTGFPTRLLFKPGAAVRPKENSGGKFAPVAIAALLQLATWDQHDDNHLLIRPGHEIFRLIISILYPSSFIPTAGLPTLAPGDFFLFPGKKQVYSASISGSSRWCIVNDQFNLVTQQASMKTLMEREYFFGLFFMMQLFRQHLVQNLGAVAMFYVAPSRAISC